MNPVPRFPTPLKKNDTLGIIAPAGSLKDQEKMRKGLMILQEMGFSVKFPRDLWPGQNYLADSDENRAKELNNVFRDPEVQGIIALRGGYGCLRILDKIDLGLIERNPKPLIGFSDITILQNYLYNSIGLISFHGPVVTSLASADFTTHLQLLCCLEGGWRLQFDKIKVEVLRQGPAVSGPLIGGNLSSLTCLLGTRYDCSWKGAIVFLEETNEPIYKIDRMLTQLFLSGKFDQAAGLILGDFSCQSQYHRAEKERYKESVWQRVLEVTQDTALAVWAEFPSGHTSANLTFPLGIHVQMHRDSARLVPC